jgi:hypothetical protein
MNFPENIIDEAFRIFEEFGPERREDRRTRIRNALNIQSEEEMDDIMEMMRQISRTIWTIAELGGEIKLGKEKVKELLITKHPYLHSRGLAKAIFLVNYFAWHEGFDHVA